ncbi:MAG: hypothetical protein H0V88_10500, partial [Pyrinomonadaceae bacterium]|nr:hypothetical protein [Pyrinomonadaceae bacterium]
MLELKSLRRPLAREALIFFAFLLLTAVMTWPAVRVLRDGVTDPADPYILAWTLWWDFHQTFRDPLHLFQANIFYPYRNTLAFSENDYGIAMLFFPLFAIGVRPLTVLNVATLVGFALCGYGAFRLARTLTHSNGAALVAGIAFAFVPYRFHKLPHLHYLFAAWLPLLLEALILFARKQSWKRASWLGVAFVMNALSCITWFVLSLVPLGLTILFFALHYRLGRKWAFWLRGGAVMFVSLLVLLPFLLPYRLVAQEYGFVWRAEEVLAYSAVPMNWLAVDWRNKLWNGLGRSYAGNELSLFPGLLPLLFALAALLLVVQARSSGDYHTMRPALNERLLRRALLVLLDVTALLAGVLALLAAGYDTFRLQLFGVQLLRITEPSRALAVFTLALCARCALAYPQVLRRRSGGRNLIETLRDGDCNEAVWMGAIWAIIGFCGSFGMNFFFHRTLYDFVPLFRSM